MWVWLHLCSLSDGYSALWVYTLQVVAKASRKTRHAKNRAQCLNHHFVCFQRHHESIATRCPIAFAGVNLLSMLITASAEWPPVSNYFLIAKPVALVIV